MSAGKRSRMEETRALTSPVWAAADWPAAAPFPRPFELPPLPPLPEL